MEQCLVYSQCCTRGSYYCCQMEKGPLLNAKRSQTLNTEAEKLKQFIGSVPSQENGELAGKIKTLQWFLIKGF